MQLRYELDGSCYFERLANHNAFRQLGPTNRQCLLYLPMGINGSCLLFLISLAVELSTGSSSGVHVGFLDDAFTLFEAISYYLQLGRFSSALGLLPYHLKI